MEIYVVYANTPQNVMAIFTRDAGGLTAANAFISANGGTLGTGTLSGYSLTVNL